MTLVTQAEYARRLGLTKAAVSQWKKAKKLVMAGTLVDVEKTDAYMEKYRTAGLSGKVKSKGKALPGESAQQAAERIITTSGANMTIEEAKRVKENYLALLNQLEYDKESGLVVEAAEVCRAVGEEYAKVRTRLLAIPAEQAPRMARMKTAAEMQDALRELITEALEELTSDIRN